MLVNIAIRRNINHPVDVIILERLVILASGSYLLTTSDNGMLFSPTTFISMLILLFLLISIILYVSLNMPLYLQEQAVPAHTILILPKFQIHGLCLWPQITKSTSFSRQVLKTSPASEIPTTFV